MLSIWLLLVIGLRWKRLSRMILFNLVSQDLEDIKLAKVRLKLPKKKQKNLLLGKKQEDHLDHLKWVIYLKKQKNNHLFRNLHLETFK
jgi:hypothetical protein